MFDWTLSGTRINRSLYYVIAGIGLIIISMILIWTTSAGIANILLNAILTIALIIIYDRISKEQRRQADLQAEVADTQRKQTELMKQQQEFTELEQRPVLQVEGYRPAEPASSRYSTSALEIKVSNIGRTPAMDLKIELITGFLEEHSLSSGRNLISVRRKDEDTDWYHEWGENHEADERNTVYIAEPLMIVWHNDDENSTKQRALEFMKFEDEEFSEIDKIRIQANLIYEGITESHSEPIFDYVFQLESYGGMDAVLERGRPYNKPMGLEISKEIKEFEKW